MLKISGIIVPQMYHPVYDGNIRRLKPFEPYAYHHDYDGSEQEESQNEEESPKPLGIMTKVAAIIFDKLVN